MKQLYLILIIVILLSSTNCGSTPTFDNSDDVTQTTLQPSINLSASISTLTNDNTPFFDGTATSSISNIQAVEYRINNGDWVIVSAADGAFDESAEYFSFTTDVLVDGVHDIEFRATDSDGVTTISSQYAAINLVVDTTPPSPPFNIVCSSDIIDTTPSFTWDASVDDISGISHYEVKQGSYINMGEVFTFTSDIEYSDGNWDFLVRAVDNAGNTGEAAKVSFTIDAVPPRLLSLEGTVSIINPSTLSDCSFNIFWDEACTNPISTLDFGDVEIPEEETSHTYINPIYFKNTGSHDIELLMGSSMWVSEQRDTHRRIIVHPTLHGVGNRLVPGEIREGKISAQIAYQAEEKSYTFSLVINSIGYATTDGLPEVNILSHGGEVDGQYYDVTGIIKNVGSADAQIERVIVVFSDIDGKEFAYYGSSVRGYHPDKLIPGESGDFEIRVFNTDGEPNTISNIIDSGEVYEITVDYHEVQYQ